MFAMTRLRLLVAAIVAGALAALLALAALSSEADASHSWGKYHWARTSNPFTLKLGDNVSTAWDSYLATTSTDWTKSTVLNTRVVAGGTNRSNCRPTSGRIEVCNYRYGSNGWLGLAQIWVSGNHIVQGVSKMNDTYFNRDKYNNPPWRRLVMCQEVGHTFGLHHQDEIQNNRNLGTCMDYTNDPNGGPGGASETDPSNEHPNAHDYEQLVSIYKHTDRTTTVSSTSAASRMPPAANQIDTNNPREWGRLVHTSPDEKLEIWQRGLGNNKKLITFVKRP
jgi:hypothetical protein